ncbi:ribosome maturation factor RimM [Duncaniella muricolitica]|jgi:16S rRNA processing protein RimM|uniref:ribosome maturation factor RimM n=1 Tax=Duncaniella muricolitica TaxID=2880704 RepID=UPI00244DDB6F|nr:ribosome maturation factor RimM [Duncaniella muricolitica]
MILRTDITEAGVFNKPHGIKGEISATLDFDIDLSDVKCIVLDVEGIFVPFFIVSVRPKTSETVLITIDGIDSEQKARTLTGRPFYLLDSDIPEPDDADGEGGFYLSDLIGFTLADSIAGTVGEITDYNDATANLLLIVTTPDGEEVYIPVADEYIDEVDTDTRTLHTTLPSGIIDLNTRQSSDS